NWTVTVNGISISGTDAGNYALQNTTASTSANITTLTIFVMASPDTKVYDGGILSTAKPTISPPLVGGDTPKFREHFDDKNVGIGKQLLPGGTVTDAVTGLPSANYNIQFITFGGGIITARALTVSATGINKVYDGTTAATVTLSDNRVSDDVLTVSY